MPQFRPLFNNFSAGEVSNKLYGRIDLPQYANACKQLKNMVPDRLGSVTTRGYFSFVGKPLNNRSVNFIPFIFSREEAYVIEVGIGYFRFWRDGKIVTNNAGEEIKIDTPYGFDEIHDIQFAQANDVMYLVADARKPRKLIRYPDENWVLDTPDFQGAPWNSQIDEHVNGFPRTICFFQQRLVFGGSASAPQTIWLSRTGDFENFEVTDTTADSDSDGTLDYIENNDVITDDQAMELVIAAYTQELIQWLSPARQLFVGTTGNEHQITPNGYIAPSNPPSIAMQSTYGSRFRQPAFIGSQTLFIQASGQKMRNYDINTASNADVFDSRDLSLFADHLAGGGFNNMAYQQIPDSILWVVTDRGQLRSLTFDPSLRDSGFESAAWADHPIDGIVESITVVPKPTADELWVVIKRSGDRFICNMKYGDNPLDLSVEQNEAIAKTTWDGFDHLIGEEISVVCDGATSPPKRVDIHGTIELDRPARNVIAGIGFTQVLETMPIEAALNDGTSLGRPSHISEIFVKILQSRMPIINGERPADRSTETPMGDSEGVFSGNIEATSLTSGEDQTITVSQDLPFKLTVQAVTGSMDIGNE